MSLWRSISISLYTQNIYNYFTMKTLECDIIITISSNTVTSHAEIKSHYFNTPHSHKYYNVLEIQYYSIYVTCLWTSS